jgi:hypothetical protein
MVDDVSKLLVRELGAFAPYPQPVAGVELPCRLFLMHLAVHLSFHLGQAGYLRRVVSGDPRTSDTVAIAELAR